MGSRSACSKGGVDVCRGRESARVLGKGHSVVHQGEEFLEPERSRAEVVNRSIGGIDIVKSIDIEVLGTLEKKPTSWGIAIMLCCVIPRMFHLELSR